VREATLETEGGERAVDAILATLRSRERQDPIALVGHEPVLSELIGRLLGGRALVTLCKGAVAVLDIDAAEGRGRLLALVPTEAVRRP
jgi:phosphohistidine phosphatase SixA